MYKSVNKQRDLQDPPTPARRQENKQKKENKGLSGMREVIQREPSVPRHASTAGQRDGRGKNSPGTAPTLHAELKPQHTNAFKTQEVWGGSRADDYFSNTRTHLSLCSPES